MEGGERRHPRPDALWRIAGPGLLAIVVLGLYRISASSLWLDEACSLAATDQLATTFRRTSGTMASYYVLLTGWVRISDSVAWLRLLSVLAAAGAILVTAVLGRRIASLRVATWGCLFLGASWMLVRYAQEVRSFAMVVLVVAAAWLALDHLVADPTDLRWGAAHLGLCVLAPLTHGLAVLPILLQVGAVLVAGVGLRHVARMVIGPAAAVLVTAGLYQYGASSVGSSTPLGWDGAVDIVHRLVAGDLPRWVPAFVPWLVLALSAYGVLVALLAARAASPGIDRFRALVPAVWGVGTPAALLALCLVRPSVHPRYAIGALPGLALLQAIATLDVQDRLRRSLPRTGRVLRVVPVVPLLLLGVLGLAQVHLHQHHDATWRSLVETVAAEAEPGDGLIAPGGSMSRLPVDANWALLEDPPPVASIGHTQELGTIDRWDTQIGGLELTPHLFTVDRLWVVSSGGSDMLAFQLFMGRPLVQSGFTIARTWSFGRLRLALLVLRQQPGDG